MICDLRGANLSNSILIETVFSDSVLSKSIFTGATINEYTVKTNWDIDDVECDFIYLNVDRTDREPKTGDFQPGDFERLYGQNNMIEIEYLGGMTELELSSIPHLLQALQEKFPEGEISFKAIEESAGGNKFRFNVGAKYNQDLNKLKSDAETEAKRLQNKVKKQEIELRQNGQLKNRVLQLESKLFRLSERNSDPNDYPQDAYLTVLFLDVVGFSSASPQEVEDTLAILWKSIPIIGDRYNAKLPNTWGDAVKVAFESEKSAIKFALRTQRVLAAWDVDIRIGIDTGELNLIYNDTIAAADVAGEIVNMAARLEPMAKAAKSNILISESTRYGESVKELEKKYEFIEQNIPAKKAFMYQGQQIEVGDMITCFAVVKRDGQV